MAKIGYARVSSRDQNLDGQLDMLQAVGCEKVFCEKASGAKDDRPEWTRLMEYMRPGDTLVVAELSRATRSLLHLLQIVNGLEQRGINIISLRENIDTTSATGRAFISIMGAINQMERELRAERTAVGRAAARSRGRTGGRPAVDQNKLEQARILYQGGMNSRKACDAAGISRRTLFKYLSHGKGAE